MGSELAAFIKRVGSRVAAERERRAVEDEIHDHLVEAALELEARGMSSEEATRSAMQQFGDPDLIGRELARVHNPVPFRFFAAGGLAWFALGAILFETGAFRISGHWLVQLPVQVLGLPHWLALQSPQVRAMSTVLRPLAQFMSNSWSVSPWHIDAAISAVILTPVAYGIYRLVRASRMPEVAQAWSLLKVAFKN